MYDGMKHMAKTPHENEEPHEPMYPYGLSLTLGKEELEKLGIDCNGEECKTGNYLHLHGLAEVTGIHKTKGMGGEEEVSLNIQITHLCAEDEGEENEEYDEDMAGAA